MEKSQLRCEKGKTKDQKYINPKRCITQEKVVALQGRKKLRK